MKAIFKTRISEKSRYYFGTSRVVSNHDMLIKLYLGRSRFLLYIDNISTTRQMYYKLRHRIKSKYQESVKRFKHWRRYNFDRKPYYYAYSHTDCDLVWVEKVGKFSNYREAYDYQNNLENYDWLEGAYSEWEISEGEYLDRLGSEYQRDYITEAWENGNGSKVIV